MGHLKPKLTTYCTKIHSKILPTLILRDNYVSKFTFFYLSGSALGDRLLKLS